MLIKSLFDPSKDTYRTIEKVITYSAAQEVRLRAEIAEYIVTDSMEAQFEELLRKMQLAMDQGGQNEVGVWVSGFYGSGKSSFTKYLGLALDDTVQVDGVRFLRHLQDRLNTPQTRAMLSATAARYPAAVVFLDLASEMLAGATMEDVATVLYYPGGDGRLGPGVVFVRRIVVDHPGAAGVQSLRHDHQPGAQPLAAHGFIAAQPVSASTRGSAGNLAAKMPSRHDGWAKMSSANVRYSS